MKPPADADIRSRLKPTRRATDSLLQQASRYQPDDSSSGVARSYLEQDDLDLLFTANFTDVDIDGQERTAVRLEVIPHPRST